MTKPEAKALTIEVWTYLAEHPEIEYKSDLPDLLYRKIAGLSCQCPLCEVFSFQHEKCPLLDCSSPSPYDRWEYTRVMEVREKAAREIVAIVSAWNPEAEEGETEA